MKQARPFEAVDNPSLSPSYEEYDADRSFSPSPVEDWQQPVSEYPTDQPVPTPLSRSRKQSASSSPDNRRASAAGSNLRDLDSLLIENSATTLGDVNSYATTAVAAAASRPRDWAPDDQDEQALHETSPKKRRVDHQQKQHQEHALHRHQQRQHQHYRRQLQEQQQQRHYHFHRQQLRQHRHEPEQIRRPARHHFHPQQGANPHYKRVEEEMGYTGVVDIDSDGYDDEALEFSNLPSDLAEIAEHEDQHGMHPDHSYSYQTVYHHPDDDPRDQQSRTFMRQQEREMPPLQVSRPMRAQNQLRIRAPAPSPMRMHHSRRLYPEDVLVHEMEAEMDMDMDMGAFPPHPMEQKYGPGPSGVRARGSPPHTGHSVQARNLYMNTYVPGMPGMPHNAYYERPTTRYPVSPHPKMFSGGKKVVFMNPANLPPHQIRQFFNLPHSMEDGQESQGLYDLPEEEEVEPFVRGPYFGGPETHDVGFDPRHQRSMISACSPLSKFPHEAHNGPMPSRRMSLPAMKFSIPDPPIRSPPVAAAAVSPVKEQQDEEHAKSPAQEEKQDDILAEDDEVVLKFNNRKQSLFIPEDVNWLSEFQTYCRKEFMDIFKASREDVKYRNTSRKVTYQQLGIRCRFCAHLHHSSRARRASAYPSSTAQIYQSFNMMIRDHFPNCEAVPAEKMDMFHKLKSRNNQGAADSKLYWSHAAEKLGMVCVDSGIFMNEITQRAARARLPFATTSDILADIHRPPMLLVAPEDRDLIAPFFYELLTRVQRVNLLDVECRSTRKNLKVGLPGFGCRYCCQAGRLGFSRIFPTKRKGLPDKINDMYEHMRRCTLCPREIKEHLEEIRPTKDASVTTTEKVFFDRVWTRLNDGVVP